MRSTCNEAKACQTDATFEAGGGLQVGTNDLAPFALAHDIQRPYLLDELNRLSAFHYEQCPQYRRIVDLAFGGLHSEASIAALPYLPVRLFKHYELLSVARNEIVKTMSSSGTSGQAVSRIFLDRQTSTLQTRVLASITTSFIGKQRLPMLVIDCPSTVSNRQKFSARTAGILGFSMFGRDVTYALNDDMELDIDRIETFLQNHAHSDVLLFGFTAIVWEHLVLSLERKGIRLPIERGVLIHGGGWKKLQSLSVSSEELKRRLRECAGIARVHNYYGMVEQTGSIFMECEHGRLHASRFSDIVIRDPLSFRPCMPGTPGLIQLLSILPRSYPGHSILSEDMGEISGVDDCPCGRKGSHFKVHGRLQDAETRGCSDTYSR